MTADDCRAVMKHLPVIKQLAKGKAVYFAMFQWDGKFVQWHATTKILLGPLHNGAYVIKPRYRYSKGKRVEIPYPEQEKAERERRGK